MLAHDQMSLFVRKPVFGVSDQVRHKLGCTATENDQRLEISNFGSRGISISVCENKDADQLRGYPKLIFVFVFAYANTWFSHVAAQI